MNRGMAEGSIHKRPFRIENPYRNPIKRGALAFAKPTLERILALPALNDIYEQIEARSHDVFIADRMLSVLGVRYKVSDEDLAKIPKTGPLIVVANHPFGGLDGIILISMLNRVRSDMKMLGNMFLRAVRSLSEQMIFVDPFGTAQSPTRNIAGLKEARQWLKEGKALGVFPAGEVAHASLHSRGSNDSPWSDTVSRLVHKSQAPVVPVHFQGGNSMLFHLVGFVHSRLRTAMLPRELLAKRQSELSVRVGNPIPFSRLQKFEDLEELTTYLRLRTFILKSRHDENEEGVKDEKSVPRIRVVDDKPIADAKPIEDVLEDVLSLPVEQRLLTQRNFEVLVAKAEQIPNLLYEIGRQRELAFRRVGEGTGNELDLDHYDDYYWHLVVWDSEHNQLVGSYRLGQTDEILPKYGVKGLYTRSLFKFGRPLVEQLDPALELGRSFVAPNYQKSYSPLMLLWKGIAQFVVANPRYKRLFGPASISNDYQSMSMQLMLNFLEINRFLPSAAKLIKPNHKPKFRPFRDWDPKMTARVVKDIAEVDELVAEIESGRAGLPVLLRQYLKLDAKLLAFSRDPLFGDALDGLLLADITKMSRPVLDKYLGKKQSVAYLEYHGLLEQPTK